MNNLEYMYKSPLIKINDNKTIYLNSYYATKTNNEYKFNIRNLQIHKNSKLSLNTLVYNNSSNMNLTNELKIKNIYINQNSFNNNDFNGLPTIASLYFISNSLPSSYLTLIDGITPTQIDNDIIYNLLNTPSNSYTLTLPYDTIGDLLMVGSGGYGGSNIYSGGGGAGEVIYINNYLFSSGTYTINIKNNLGYTPTDVRQYPPKTYTSLSSRSGSIPYYKTMTLDSSGITYGSGDYIVAYSSSYYNGSYEGDICFDRQITAGQYYLTQDNLYNINTGLYTGSRYLVSSSYKGEWVYIKLPIAISLCYYNIISGNGVNIYRAPSLFKIYGSNDGTNWEEITQASNDTNALTTNEYPLYFGIGYLSALNLDGRYKKILSTPSKPYQYFGMVINKIISNNSLKALGIMEWELYGYEDAYSNSITKLNILSHYRDLIPKVYTSVADLGTISQNGSTNYRWSMTLDSSGVESNEAGTYEITCTGSGTYVSSFPYNFLSRTTNSSSFTCNTTASYTSGVYNGGRYLESASYKGEWFYIKLPILRPLYGYSIMNGAQSANLMGEWKFYGSMTGVDGSWVEITDGSQTSRIATTDYIQNGSYWYITKYFTNPTNYLYYGICCNKLTTTGTTTLLWGNELYLLTKDILTITDKPSSSDGSVSIIKDNTTLITAKAGGNGGWYSSLLNISLNPTSGGSGGGGGYYRIYPPKAYNSSTSRSSITFLGQSAYTMTLTLNSTGITYGIGDYILYYSSYYTAYPTLYTKDLLFNYSVDAVGAHWEVGNYSDPTGTYNVVLNNYIKNDYLGDWIVIKLPEQISLSSYFFKARPGLIYRAPGLWRCYGSNDGVNFTLIPNASNDITSLTQSSYTSDTYTKTISTISPFYYYIGFTFNKLVGRTIGVDPFPADVLNFDEIRLFGNYSSGATAGTAFNNIYTTGLVGNGNNGTSTQGGSGGGVSFNSSISGSSITYAVGGSGATDISTPISKTNGTGNGGDGNNGIGAGGSCILRMKSILNENIINENNHIEIEEQNINEITIINKDVNNTNLNFQMILDITDID